MALPPPRKRLLRVGMIAAILLVLATLLFVQQAFNLPSFLRPSTSEQTVVLFALTTIIVLSLLVFTMVLSRNLIKLYIERKTEQLGSKFKTKLLLAFLGLSLVPVIFLFVFAYGLVNRSLDKWFSLPVDSVLRSARGIVDELQKNYATQGLHAAEHVAHSRELIDALSSRRYGRLAAQVDALADNVDAAAVGIYDAEWQPIYFRKYSTAFSDALVNSGAESVLALLHETKNPSSGMTEFYPDAFSGNLFATVRVHDSQNRPIGVVVVGTHYPTHILDQVQSIAKERENYMQLSRDIKSFKKIKVLTLLLITLVILFCAAWVALFIAKRITVPIQALAEATQKIAQGDFDHQVTVSAHDELKMLVDSFNQMTAQLKEKTETIARSTDELQRANRELEARRHYIETILESIPTTVLSLDRDHRIVQWNGAASRVLHLTRDSSGLPLRHCFTEETETALQHLIQKSVYSGLSTREMTLPLGDRLLYCAVTVCALRDAERVNAGYVLVIEDLTELLKAQKSAAWREVAKRIAHEIKNPLTPIQLSAQRLLKHLEKQSGEASLSGEAARSGDGGGDLFQKLVAECARTIEQEVIALKGMVDEFSRFARLPATKPIPTDLNRVIEQTLTSYDGRLQDIRVEKRFSPLPLVPLDPEQFKRVFVNLIDNAIEAMEDVSTKRLLFTTKFDPRRETIEVVIEDSGHGVRPADLDKLFLPYFSTRKRGTGLGLAIVNRIVADHNGLIRAESNAPHGARFIIELPVLAQAV